jgi:sugar phosphate isomerase/epimerase
MTLSKKHYIAIAAIIQENRKHGVDVIIHALGNYFGQDNERFEKHYIAIAAIIQENRKYGVDVLIHALGNYFGQDNERFDYARFVAACEEVV